MAKRDVKRKNKKEAPQPKRYQKWHSEKHLSFGAANYIVFALGILSIIVGFILLEMRSMTLAPLLLVIGFSFLIPISIIIGIGKGGDVEERLKESGGKIE